MVTTTIAVLAILCMQLLV